MPRFPLALLGVLLFLSACRTDLPPGGIAALDGHWEGSAAAARGIAGCAQLTPYAMTVRNGDIEGVIRNPLNATGVAGRFYGFVETDGTVTMTARTMANDVTITGRFETTSSFFGEAKSPDCTARLRLDKRRGL